MSRFFSQVKVVAAADIALLHRSRALLGSAIGLTFVPMLYAVIYVSSLWDPAAHSSSLPVALVNSDAGVTYRGQRIDLGDEVQKKLEQRRIFHFLPMASVKQARDAVAESDAYFAVVLPADFSARAVPGNGLQQAKLQLLVGEGTSLMGANIASRFGLELTHQLNESLNEKRWQLVLGKLGESKSGLAALKEGADRLRAGAKQLDTGAHDLARFLGQAKDGAHQLSAGDKRVAAGVGQLTTGMKQLGAGVRLMAEKIPTDAALEKLQDGSHTLSEKHDELVTGLAKAREGAAQLQAGARKLKEGSAKIPIVGRKISDGARQIEEGLAKLEQGLQTAHAGSAQLASGQRQLDGGVQRLAEGVKKLGGGVRTMNNELPTDAKLKELDDGAALVATKLAELGTGLDKLHEGSARLADGSAQLADGLAVMYAKIPSDVQGLDGDAAGLAASVILDSTAVTKVPNNGHAFAPYFVALALWVGSVMTSFLFWFRRLSSALAFTSQGARLTGKMAVPAMLVLAQAMIMTLAMRLILRLDWGTAMLFWVIAMSGSLSFMTIVFTCIVILGDAGRAVAILFLIFQLASAGGPFPVEMSGPVFQFAHPFLPITDIIKALRALMFGAYGGAWWRYELRMLATALVFFCGAFVLGRRWKIVEAKDYTAALDL